MGIVLINAKSHAITELDADAAQNGAFSARKIEEGGIKLLL